MAPYKGKFNSYPPKRVYWGAGKMSGETLLAGGVLALMASFHQLVDRGYFVSNYQMASNHFQMDNIIMVDGNYRWIPTRMAPPEHADGGYSYQEQEQDWTPTDGKGL